MVGSDDNLFDFGDVDGGGTEARLQHPLGIAYADDGFLYVADTNNHSVRIVDLASAAAGTLVLKGIEAFAPPPGAADFFGEVIEVAAFANPNIELPPDHKFNEAAPSSAEFSTTGGRPTSAVQRRCP